MTMTCRSCHGRRGEVVLDLGKQPPCDVFPAPDIDPASDLAHPLRMWLCSVCGLAQLAEDPGFTESPSGVEPAALTLQARAAIARLADDGLLPEGDTVAEFPSPHGGSWLPLLRERGLHPVPNGDRAQVVLDCFGMMHEADQERALADRVARLESGGTLLLQYHSLATIIRYGQWNMLRHNHFAYYATPVLVEMLAALGLVAEHAWWFDLYGGTVLLSARAGGSPGTHLQNLMGEEYEAGVTDPGIVCGLRTAAGRSADRLRRTLREAAKRGQTVAGYPAASRAVALLKLAHADSTSLQAVGDGSAAKHGSRMPGTDIPIVSPAKLVDAKPDVVLLFLPDMMTEVSADMPELAQRWVTVQ